MSPPKLSLEQAASALERHCQTPPRRVLWDAAAGLLLDLPSGKALKVGAPQVASAGVDEQQARPLLELLLEDGRALRLTDDGICFAPLFTNTGPLEELPKGVCWSDFARLVARLKEQLYAAQGGPGLATVRVLMCCLAIVDGARAAGFEVAAEELELQWHLAELERRAPG